MDHRYLDSYVDALTAIDALRDQVAILAFEKVARADPELASAAVRALGAKERAALWLSHEIPALGNKTPLFLASHDEREILLAELNAIEYGNWA